MPARRCSTCARNYPIARTFEKCLVCGEKTDYIQNDEPMDADELTSLRNQLEFERFYEATRGVPPDHEGDPADDPYRAAVDAIAAPADDDPAALLEAPAEAPPEDPPVPSDSGQEGKQRRPPS